MQKIQQSQFERFEQFSLDSDRLKEIKGGGKLVTSGTFVNDVTYCQGDTWLVATDGSDLLLYAPSPLTSTGLCSYAGNLA